MSDHTSKEPRSEQASTCWIFQGNPKRYDINDYLSRYPSIYWRAPIYRSQIQMGDRCIIWRSGDEAGAVAIGRIKELPQKASEIKDPECLGDDLWHADESETDPDTIYVGIQIDEVRLDEESDFIPRSAFKANPILSQSTIITTPQGTVFKLNEEETKEVFCLWKAPLDLSVPAQPEAMEGARELKQHYARERNRGLIDKKKELFASEHDGQVFCEVCQFDFASHYPPSLGDGFIEVHHLDPLFTQERPRRTTYDRLLLVCSNCHRMIHRTKDVDRNLRLLKAHFS